MLTTLPPPCAVVMKSGNLNFLEPSGPLQACNGTALPLPSYTVHIEDFNMYITPLEETYRLWCVVDFDLETSRMRRPWPTVGCCAE